ncbi:DUF222 domain-containing protein [Mycobacterium sp. NPDC003323]
MFEGCDRDTLAGMSDEALITAVAAATRSEATAAAQRLALIAEVTARHCEDEDEDSALKLIDGWAQAKAQISAACNLGPHATNTQMRIGVALRQRLPRTAALFATGALSAKVIGAITWRTHLVTDPEAMAHIDAGIAEDATGYGTLSEAALVTAVDHWVHRYDPVAVIRSKAAAKDRYIEFGDSDDPDGVVSFWGRMRATDATITNTRLDQLADTVCDHDPRTTRERRADAAAALAAGADRLTCLCGNPDCEGSGKDPRASAVNIYVLANELPDTGHGANPTPEPGPTPPGTPADQDPPRADPGSGEEPTPDTEPGAEPQPPAAPAAKTPPAPRTPASPPGARAGITVDGTIIPAHLLAELIATGATVRPLSSPADLGSESRYRPSAKLAAYVRMTVMTCSFPGCGKPAHRCDLDHVVPWPAGATHPANLRPLCREHHLLKTLNTGWTPKANPDATTTWISPTGHRYTAAPLAAVLFPHNTIDIPIPPVRHISLIDDHDTTPVLPRRQRTRKHDREYRINAERTRNATELALEHTRAQTSRAYPGPRTAGGYTDSDPPPF